MKLNKKPENKKYIEAAIVFSLCSFIYFLFFMWRGISSKYGPIFFAVLCLFVFLIFIVPYFVYNGSRGWTLTFAWIYLIRSVSSTWALYAGMGHGIIKYVLPTIYICTIMLFRAGWAKKKENIPVFPSENNDTGVT